MGEAPSQRGHAGRSRTVYRLVAAALAVGVSSSQAWGQGASDEDGDKLLRAVSSCVGGPKALIFDHDTDHEIVDRTLTVLRPGKLRVTRKDPYPDLEATVGGSATSLSGRGLNVLVQMERTTIDAGVVEFCVETGLDAAGADLISTDIDPATCSLVRPTAAPGVRLRRFR